MATANRTRVVTVFGGSGFIGRHLIRRLTRTGAVVRIASRHPGEARQLRMAGAVGQVVPVPTNVTDDRSVAAALAGSTDVVNLIGILSETGRWTFQTVHAEVPGRIASLAAAAGVGRLVHISAIGADAASPAAYARSKAAGEAAVLAAFPNATILRPSIVFGPEDGFFNRFAGMAVLSPFLPLVGGGHTRFQPVYVGDVAAAIEAALDRADVVGRTYELGGPEALTFKQLLEYVLKEIRRKRALITLPWGVAKLQASVLEKLPNPMLTRDQVEMLKTDNVVHAGALTLKDLGIDPTALEVIVPTYLERFRPGGRFSRTQAAT